MSLEPLSPIRYKRLFQYITRMPNLVAYYPMFEQEGTICRNYAPATRGTLNGTITGAGLGFTGKAGKSYSFDGTNDRVSATSMTQLSSVAQFSLVALCYADNVTQDHYVCGTRNTDQGILLWHDDVTSTSGRTDAWTFFIRSGAFNPRVETATNSAKANTWQMIATTFIAASATGMRFYINGIEDANSPVDATTLVDSGGASTLSIGEQEDGTKDRSGRIQHIAVFNTSLSSSKVLKLAQIAGLA